MKKLYPHQAGTLFGICVIIFNSITAIAQDISSIDDLKKLSVEELMNIEVTSVSKKPEKLDEVASAIQVITNEEIRRSGATNIPEALRLASNLQVAQLNSSAWIISARGFNAAFSNKLLVMIDGRTVYTPLFAGVFWDVQNYPLEDVERIEIISGPGGAIWGANAVNGVINIITKKASETQGVYASAGIGTFLRENATLRYGGKINSNLSYRLYGMYFRRDHTLLPNESDNTDKWKLGQAGFSVDWTPSDADDIIISGNLYGGTHDNTPSESTVDGQNILTRWSRKFDNGGSLVIQAYYDRTWRRDIPSTISDQTETVDFEFDHSFQLARSNRFVWGGGYRFMDSQTHNGTPLLGLVPPMRRMYLYSGFIQDELSFINERLKLTLGGKIQHNVFSGFEVQPTARLAWTASVNTFWGSVSRAIRAPSRIDVDYHLPTFPLPPESPSVAGGPNFTSEKLVAWEAGYRFHSSGNVSLSVSVFNNKYDDLYSVEALPNTLTYQIQNGTEGTSQGVEFTGKFQISKSWRLHAGYSYFDKTLKNKPGRIYDHSDLGNDAKNRVVIHSILDLPKNFQFDVTFRYIDTLPKPHVSDYSTFDARLAWIYKKVELSVVGQNLYENQHAEFVNYIPRAIYANVACRF